MIPITKTTKIVLAVVFTLLVIAALAVIVWHETKCKPKCANKHCGNDGCGGTCGSCDDGEYCDANKHKCLKRLPVVTPKSQPKKEETVTLQAVSSAVRTHVKQHINTNNLNLSESDIFNCVMSKLMNKYKEDVMNMNEAKMMQIIQPLLVECATTLHNKGKVVKTGWTNKELEELEQTIKQNFINERKKYTDSQVECITKQCQQKYSSLKQMADHLRMNRVHFDTFLKDFAKTCNIPGSHHSHSPPPPAPVWTDDQKAQLFSLIKSARFNYKNADDETCIVNDIMKNYNYDFIFTGTLREQKQNIYKYIVSSSQECEKHKDPTVKPTYSWCEKERKDAKCECVTGGIELLPLKANRPPGWSYIQGDQCELDCSQTACAIHNSTDVQNARSAIF
jgi:hypothetical protein